MIQTELDKQKKKLEKLFGAYRSSKNQIISSKLTRGKIYEAFVLSKVLESLNKTEKLFIVLKNDNSYKLKSSPSAVNRKYPRFDLYKTKSDYELYPDNVIAEIWTDVEFLTLSYASNSKRRHPSRGEYHELDILITAPKIRHGHRPTHEQVYLGIECKNTNYKKSYLREILGVRRELSLISNQKHKTKFQYWPRVSINAKPASCLMVYCIDSDVNKYDESGKLHSIDFKHQII
ncbi:hypothetical protein QYS49_32290 [Marivirga salinae]|uniref:Uncharacterized protein n=1 Tax=Marivirga salinarum TaxID=3059078 RepID=A0AA51NBG8_9BACT|nr:hypothetical protein [Marivirga sp. BDSF4-3]WMN12073.1 hypothetical protein QYS49_32290 [Marivirga sp. BDSF4-3]